MDENNQYDRFYEILSKNRIGLDVLDPSNQIKYVKPDDDNDFHSYRILLLIKMCGIIKEHIAPYEMLYGRRKFAFYDFLIRYPFYLEKVVERSKKKKILVKLLDLKPYERSEVFSPMIKYIRGPWDFSYDNVFNYLISKELVEVNYKFINKNDQEFTISLTSLGNEKAIQIKEIETTWVNRMNIINNIFRIDTTNKKIDEYISQNFKELLIGLGERLDVY
jgi:hypothetical protein